MTLLRLADRLAVGIDRLACAGLQCNRVGLHHGQVDEVATERRGVSPAVVIRKQLAGDLIGSRQSPNAADLVARRGPVEVDPPFVNDLELDRDPCDEHRRPDSVTVHSRCSTYLQLARSQRFEPVTPDHLAQLAVGPRVGDQEMDVDRFTELPAVEDDRRSTSEPAVVLGQERCIKRRQHLGHPLMVQPPKQGASRCCRCPPGAG